jgi:hypothetical protein
MQYLCWAELLLASAFNPSASFFGHLCGILAGFLHVLYIEPALRAAQRSWMRLNRQTQGPGRQLGGQTTGRGSNNRPSSPPTRPTGVQTSSPSSGRGNAARVQGAGPHLSTTGTVVHGRSSSSPPDDQEQENISLEELRQRRLIRLGASAGGSTGTLRGRAR